MLRLTWTENALEDLDWWQQHDAKMLKRIIQLCLIICKNPTKGIGKPEPLKHAFAGFWSRRINDEHRMVYRMTGDQLEIAQLRFHY